MKSIIVLLLFISSYSYSQIELGSGTDGKPAPKLWIETNSYSFGKIPFNVPATVTFEIKNTGDAPLLITKAEPTCNCTLVDYTKDEIPPGGNGFVKATFDARIVGKFDKRIFLYTNAYEGEMDLILKGEVFFISNK
ncbi:MAG TPA: DUF1573 domain-containing protein [Bacteroidetes bacterium]|nr:DUF1573 domain-containing protein [Bacteroidota bacterium]